MSSLPFRTSFKTSSLGIGNREAYIIVSGLAVGLINLGVDYTNIFVRIVVFFIISSAALFYSLYRVKGEFPIEVYLVNRFKYLKSERKFVKGGAWGKEDEKDLQNFIEKKAPAKAALFYLPTGLSPRNNEELFLYVSCYCLCGISLAWFGTGGVTVVSREITEIIYALRVMGNS